MKRTFKNSPDINCNCNILELSVRQEQRLVHLYRTDGATAFASSYRGRPANNRLNEESAAKL